MSERGDTYRQAAELVDAGADGDDLRTAAALADAAQEHGYGTESDCVCGRNFAKVRGLREHITNVREGK